MTLEIRERDFEAFFAVPGEIYGRRLPFVSILKPDLARLLNPAQNPTFRSGRSDLTYFTAHRQGRPVGRITAQDHVESNEIHGLSRSYFGYFDVADDADAARALLGRAEDWGRARGHGEIAGNFNLTAMQQIGVVTGGFEHPPYTDLVWSPPWLPGHLEAAGYEAFFPMTTFEVDLTRREPPGIGPKQQAILDDPDFSFAPITRANVLERLEETRQILNASFAKNPMFVATTHDEFHFQAKDMKWVIDTRISAVLHHRGRPAACILVVPDFNPMLRAMGSRMRWTAPWHFLKHKLFNRRAVLIFSGVIPELQGQGVNPLVLNRVIAALKKAGYTHLGNTWIGDGNRASLVQKEKAGARKLHRLHLYRKAL